VTKEKIKKFNKSTLKKEAFSGGESISENNFDRILRREIKESLQNSAGRGLTPTDQHQCNGRVGAGKDDEPYFGEKRDNEKGKQKRSPRWGGRENVLPRRLRVAATD